MDAARLNFSHGDLSDHDQVYRTVRNAADDAGRAVGILPDLQGPKIRPAPSVRRRLALTWGTETFLVPLSTRPTP